MLVVPVNVFPSTFCNFFPSFLVVSDSNVFFGLIGCLCCTDLIIVMNQLYLPTSFTLHIFFSVEIHEHKCIHIFIDTYILCIPIHKLFGQQVLRAPTLTTHK